MKGCVCVTGLETDFDITKGCVALTFDSNVISVI